MAPNARGGLTRLSRNGVDHARRFRDVASAVAALPVRTLVLDGEVAIFDEQLRSRFELLRRRDPEVVANPRSTLRSMCSIGTERI